MAHPFRGPPSNRGNRRAPKGQPFDPEDLSRRLEFHIAEQKLRAEKRRTARQAKEEGPHAYVPMVAAAAFQRTATRETVRQVHRLSQPALKQQAGHSSIDDPNRQLSDLQRTQAADKALVERHALRNRNQFQWMNGMEQAAAVDIQRDVYKLPQRTFISEFAQFKGRHVERPLSTGDVVSSEDDPTRGSKTNDRLNAAFAGRNDWAQRDEGDSGRLIKEKSSMFLRKKDSLWLMKGKREKHGKQDQDDAVIVIGDSGSSPNGSKSGSHSFLARFKRHPS